MSFDMEETLDSYGIPSRSQSLEEPSSLPFLPTPNCLVIFPAKVQVSRLENDHFAHLLLPQMHLACMPINISDHPCCSVIDWVK